MLYTYQEVLKKYLSVKELNIALKNQEIFKIDHNIYSDNIDISKNAIITKKYPKAVFTSNSAFYYQGLTDTIPEKYHILTDKDATKIKDTEIKQYFDNNNSLDLGVEIKDVNGDLIRVFTKERLLIELIRYKKKLPFDYYKEIINSYRLIKNELNFQKIEEFSKCLPIKIVEETILLEVL